MNVALTLLVRNEADILDANIAYHLSSGVDFVVATDNESDDDTVEILERYERAGVLHLHREPTGDVLQEYWVTDMARVASELGADWVINSDADEFWWSRKGPLKDMLERVPGRFATVRAFMRNFVPRGEDDGDFAERMTDRIVSWRLPPDSPFHGHPYHPQDKVVHRAHPQVTISGGNHDARWAGSVDLRGWWPLEILHFPIRSVVQAENKRLNWTRHRYGPLEDLVVGTAQEYYDSLAIDDDAREYGVADGWLVQDTRIRDALGNLERGLAPATFSTATYNDDALFAAEISAGVAIDSVARAHERLGQLEARGARLQHPLAHRAIRRLTPSLARGDARA